MISRYSRIGLTLFAAALYGGPVMAGFAQHGGAVLPVFAALFLLYVSAQRKPDLASGAGWAALAVLAAIQLVLVTAAWGAGGLVASLTNAIDLPVWAPIAITALAAAAGAWAFRDAAEMNVMLDDALAKLEAMNAAPETAGGDPWPEAAGDVQEAVERACDKLRALPLPEPGFADAIVEALAAEAGPAAFDPLYDAAGQDGAANEPGVDFGLLRFVARPEICSALIARGEAGLAPMLMLGAPDPAVRKEARGQVRTLMRRGVPCPQLPGSDWIEELDARFPDEGYAGLARECARYGA